VWQLLGVEHIQNGGRCHGNQGIIFVFFIFLAFLSFPWQRQPFGKNKPLKAQLHMAYDIPTRFHKV
jgi:hypothetical protein